MRKSVRVLAAMLSVLCVLTGMSGCGGKRTAVSDDGSSATSTTAKTHRTDASGSDVGADVSGDVVTSEGIDVTSGDSDVIRPNGNGGTTSQGGGSGEEGGTKATSGQSAAVTDDSFVIDTDQEKMFESLKGTTVRIISNSSEGSLDEQQVAAVVKKKYDLNVEYVGMSWYEMQDNIAALVAGGNPPDLSPFSEVLSLRYAYGNLAQPIDRYLVKNDPVWTTNDALGRFTYDGKVYGAVDYGYDVFLVYYNKTMFEENNVKEPLEYYNEGNWNFDTFKQVAKQMTLYEDDGVTQKTFGFTTWYYPVFIMADGGKGIDYANGKWFVTMDGKAEMTGMQMMRDMAADGTFLYGSDGYVDFRQRKIAMTIERPMNAIGTYDYYNRMDDEIGMVPLPKGPDVSQYYAPVMSDANFVTATAQNPLGAVAFMYEKRAYKMKKQASTDADILAERRKVISDEHLALYNDYMSKAVIAYNLSEGMSGWWDGPLNRNQVWNKIIFDQSQPSQVVDSIKGLMLDSLKRTVGASNVRS